MILTHPAMLAGLVLMLSLMLSGLATAQTQLSPEARREAAAALQACRPDYASLCNGMQPGGGRIMQCLRSNAARLSPNCSAAITKVDSMRAAAK